MDIGSIILIALGAVIGVIMLTKLLQGHNVPKGLTILHGLLVVSGLVLLIIFNLTYPAHANWISVGLFLLAAAGGLFVLSRDIKHQKVPLPVVFIHGIVAASSFSLMVYYYLTSRPI